MSMEIQGRPERCGIRNPVLRVGCSGAGADGVARGYIQNVQDSIFGAASFCLIRRICISADKETL